MDLIANFIAYWFGTRFADTMTKDNRDDPVYKKNVRELIERNRQFEKQHEPDTELRDDHL